MRRLFMSIAIGLLILCCSTSSAFADDVKSNTSKEKVHEVIEHMPEFPGGIPALMEYLSENIVYPNDAYRMKIQGRVLIEFVVEIDGSISEIKVVKSVYPSLDREAKRVVSTMPKWNPGKHKGEAVRVKFTLPITYRLK